MKETEEALHCHTEVEVSASNNKKLLKSKRERESDIIYARAGKWTHEEETFATKLMDEFEAGRLPDIPMKQTLRKLLSQKLQCNKMRISKKFGGRCYGKVPYKSYKVRNNPTDSAVTDMDELAKLEYEFLLSIHAHHPACPLSEEMEASLPPPDAIHSDFKHFSSSMPPYYPTSSSLTEIPPPVGSSSSPSIAPSNVSMKPPLPVVVGGKPVWRQEIKSPTVNRLQTLMKQHPQQLDEHPYIHYKSLFNPFVHSFHRDCVPVLPVNSIQLSQCQQIL